MAVSALEPKRRILVVDDDRNCTHLIKVLLEKTGWYVVLEENDPTKAHQDVRDFRPDVILLDVEMPLRDGGDVAAQIGTDPELQRTPIIFLTGLITKAEVSAGLRVQGRPTLAKPIGIPELIEAIQTNLPPHTGFQTAPRAVLDEISHPNCAGTSRSAGD
jgi:CheY-like chemotaxis protein